MNATQRLAVHVSLRSDGSLHRRGFLKAAAASSVAAGLGIGANQLAARAEDVRKQGRACIVLWMQGGPSQLETFDPKPGHANGGETKAIETSVSGVRWADNLPNLAKQADKLAVIRSLTSREGEHQRATYLMHTAYLPGGGVQYPAMGAIVARDVNNSDCELPPFVRVGNLPGSLGAGFLGTAYEPFILGGAGRAPDNTRIATDEPRFRSRLDLMARLETASRIGETDDHAKLYRQASEMILSPRMQAFDLEQEPAAMREAYGATQFGSGCLLARRLVESGVTFVEVSLGGWDTHDNNFARSRTLCEQLDRPFATLLSDLADRGLLDTTLVLWAGEFGRTPRINPRGGRDHYPRAFSAAMAGSGIRGGQVIGSTDAGGENVADQPVSEKDLFQTAYKALKIDATKQNMSPIGRPIRVVDGGAPVEALL